MFRAFIGVMAALAALAPTVSHSVPPEQIAPAAAPGTRVDQFWQRALTEVYRTPGELKAQREQELRKKIHYRILPYGNKSIKAVALTFDDGPHPQYTPQLLDVLDKYNVKATFFVVGKMAEAAPQLIRAEVADGHTIANHTYHHVNLTRIPIDEIATEYRACSDVIKSITGHAPQYCRPPGGDYDPDVIQAAQAENLTTVLWTDDPGDYASPGTNIIDNRTLRAISPGGIILLHDGVQQTIKVLPQIIESLQKRGYSFVTVDEMDRQARRASSTKR